MSKTKESSIYDDNRDEQVQQILNKYGYGSTSEIKMKDYKPIIDDFSKLVKK